MPVDQPVVILLSQVVLPSFCTLPLLQGGSPTGVDELGMLKAHIALAMLGRLAQSNDMSPSLLGNND